MDDRVELADIGGRGVANVQRTGGLELVTRPEVAAAIEERVEPDDVMSSGVQERWEDGADVAVMARHEHPQAAL
jgi:hypothetical protein